MIKKFKGKIEFGDSCRVGNDDLDGAIHIGGVDVIAELEPKEFNGKVTVAIADQRFTGDLSVDMGWGYSEYTPMESDELTVGAHDILKTLRQYEAGQEITLWVADEPINTLEDVAAEQVHEPELERRA
jgi:hypothetical protein